MAEIQLKQAGEQSPSFNTKKKIKFNRKTILIVGGGMIVAFFLFKALTNRGQATAVNSADGVYADGYSTGSGGATNSADVQGQLQNYNDMITSDVQSVMGNALSSLETQVGNLQSYVDNNNNQVLSDMTGIMGNAVSDMQSNYTNFTNDYQSQLDKIISNNEAIQTANQESYDALNQKLIADKASYDKKLKATEAKAAKDVAAAKKISEEAAKKAAAAADKKINAAQKKADAAAATAKKAMQQSKVSPTKTSTTNTTVKKETSIVNGIKGNTKTVSVVDYLKSAGVNSSMDNRQKLASAAGISNYKGTASQNTKLLATLKTNADKPKATTTTTTTKKTTTTPAKTTTTTKKTTTPAKTTTTQKKK